MLLAALFVVGGGLALAAQRRTTPPLTGYAERRHAGGGPAPPRIPAPGRARPYARGFFGAMQVSVAAYAVERGTPDAAALLYFAFNCTNLVRGWAYGARRHGGHPDATRPQPVPASRL